MIDNVNPNHYRNQKGYQAIDIIEDYDLNFSRGNAIKYILRAGKKTDSLEREIEDLEKAKWYIEREVIRLQQTVEKV